MPTYSAEFQIAQGDLLGGGLRTRILNSTDWTDLHPATAITTTTSQVLNTQSAQNLNVASTTGFEVGRTIQIGTGANRDFRRITAINSATQLALSAGTYVYGTANASGVAVTTVQTLFRATTTNGAQMVIDLGDQMSDRSLGIGFYRSHDGTTGVDRLGRWVGWRNNAGNPTDNVHCFLSLGKDHFYLYTTGPRAGETNAESATAGSMGTAVGVSEVVPYFPTTDTTPAVAVIASINAGHSQNHDGGVMVSRNAANTSSWVPARLGSISLPTPGNSALTANTVFNRRPDGSAMLWPYVVGEMSDGPRGRLKAFHFTGFSGGESAAVVGQRVSMGGATYITTMPYRFGVHSSLWNGFGASTANAIPVLAVPVM